MTEFRDLYGIDEDERIAAIGLSAMAGKRCAFMVEDDGEKADRYIAKMREKFPRVVIGTPTKGPVRGVLTITAGPPGSGPN